MRFAVLFALLPVSGFAQDGIRPSDTILNQAEMSGLLTGQIVEFYDGSKSRYSGNGDYAYTYTDDDPAWTGTYEFRNGSVVCVAFDNGSDRCDRFVRDGDRLVLVVEDGTRFPVRNLSVYNN